MSAIWHDLECGRYTADLDFWLALAARRGDPVLDVGAGTGRVTLALARAGHRVVAIDLFDELLEVLRTRAGGLEVSTVVADARSFWLGAEFPVCIVPMQTIQLLGGPDGRRAFLECARHHLSPRGVLAVAITSDLEEFEVGEGEVGPLPDVGEIDGVVYSSRPMAVRATATGHQLERRRETVTAAGELIVERDLIELDRLDADTLESEGEAVGLEPASRLEISPTDDHVGSTVVMFRG